MRKTIARNPWKSNYRHRRDRRGHALATIRTQTPEALQLQEKRIVRFLREHHLTLSLAESCTGGMVSSRIVNVPGASEVFIEGFVTYSEAAKMRHLGVKSGTLDQYTAVSAQTAAEMARGGCQHAGTEVCVSVTGYAGPGGGTKEHPVGTVYIGCCLSGKVVVRSCHFNGSRAQIRLQAADCAMQTLESCLHARYHDETK